MTNWMGQVQEKKWSFKHTEDELLRERKWGLNGSNSGHEAGQVMLMAYWAPTHPRPPCPTWKVHSTFPLTRFPSLNGFSVQKGSCASVCIWVQEGWMEQKRKWHRNANRMQCHAHEDIKQDAEISVNGQVAKKSKEKFSKKIDPIVWPKCLQQNWRAFGPTVLLEIFCSNFLTPFSENFFINFFPNLLSKIFPSNFFAAYPIINISASGFTQVFSSHLCSSCWLDCLG